MGQFALFFGVLCTALMYAETQFDIGRKVQFRRIAMCPKYRNFTMVTDKVRFKYDKHGIPVSMSHETIITRRIKRIIFIVSFQKCDDDANLDSCEYFLKDYNASNTCDLIGKKGQVWSLYADHFSIKKCPIEVGKYYAVDVPLSSTVMTNLLPLPNAKWLLNIKGYDETGLFIYCVNIEFVIYIGRTRPSI